MIRINQLTLPVDHGEEAIKKKAAKLLKIDESAIGEIRIVHRSIDARKKPNLLFSYIVDVTLAGGKKEAAVILHLPQILTPQHGSNIPHAVLSFN